MTIVQNIFRDFLSEKSFKQGKKVKIQSLYKINNITRNNSQENFDMYYE